MTTNFTVTLPNLSKFSGTLAEVVTRYREAHDEYMDAGGWNRDLRRSAGQITDEDGKVRFCISPNGRVWVGDKLTANGQEITDFS